MDHEFMTLREVPPNQRPGPSWGFRIFAVIEIARSLWWRVFQRRI